MEDFFAYCLEILVDYLKRKVHCLNYMDDQDNFKYIINFLMLIPYMRFFRQQSGTTHEFRRYWAELRDLNSRGVLNEGLHMQERDKEILEIIKHIEGAQMYDHLVDYHDMPDSDGKRIYEAISRLGYMEDGE